MYEFLVFHVQKSFLYLFTTITNFITELLVYIVDRVTYLTILFHNFFSFIKRQGHLCCLCYGDGQAE